MARHSRILRVHRDFLDGDYLAASARSEGLEMLLDDAMLPALGEA